MSFGCHGLSSKNTGYKARVRDGQAPRSTLTHGLPHGKLVTVAHALATSLSAMDVLIMGNALHTGDLFFCRSHRRMCAMCCSQLDRTTCAALSPIPFSMALLYGGRKNCRLFLLLGDMWAATASARVSRFVLATQRTSFIICPPPVRPF